MRKPKRIAALASCALLCMPYVANAATVSGPSGAVHVNAGKGFVALTGPAEVGPGAQVMVKPGQVATIAYGNDCSVKVGGERVWTVQAVPPCAKGGGEVDLTGRMNQAGPGEGIGGGALLIGGAIIGGGLLIGCLASWCRNDKSSSP